MVRNVAALVLAAVVAVTLGAGGVPARAGGAGQQRTDVVGGDLAPEGMFPWMVRLSMGCGGALTAPRVVLTAGHCVTGTGPDTTIEVTAGAADLKSYKAVVAHSVRVFRAPGFTDETRGNDWALIQLDRKLALPPLELSTGKGDKGDFTVLGWGQISEAVIRQETKLRYAKVPFVPDYKCARDYQKVGVKLVPTDQICAGDAGADTCQGDSGGPMVRWNSHAEWVQVGIVSWGLGCARAGYPGVYSQVSTFRAAIRAATKSLS
jgi:secreted trypsin-like serine protease